MAFQPRADDMSDHLTMKVNAFARHLEAANRSLAHRINEVAGRQEVRSPRDREEIQALMTILKPLDLATEEWNYVVNWIKNQE